ncbi:hypothetical protein ACFQS2_10970 [Brachybacterium sp. GCM10030267]|uniref:hypothetical protein n=1 Tax=unclassified Brachybacterium TaxID=2623841 RepID=UPI00360A2A0F
MTHNISVIVRAEIDSRAMRLVTTGCLTEESQQALFSLILKARDMHPAGQVTVDLTETLHIDTTGLNLLRAAVDHDEHVNPGEPILFLIPDSLPPCPEAHDLEPVGVK